MKEPKWLLPELIVAIQKMVLAEHGGEAGVRDDKLFESALNRPKQKYHYEPSSSLFDLAAAYSYGLAKNHAFIDGNKRIALLAGLVFLEINHVDFDAPEAEATIAFEELATGTFSESELSHWFELHSRKA